MSPRLISTTILSLAVWKLVNTGALLQPLFIAEQANVQLGQIFKLIDYKNHLKMIFFKA